MKQYAIGLILAAGLVSADSQSQPIHDAHRCDNCSNSQQMQGVAIQNGVGTRYVYSLTNVQIRKFDVERWCGEPPQEADGGNGVPSRRLNDHVECASWQYRAQERPVESEVAGFLADMVSAYQAYGNSFHGFEEVQYSELAPFLSGVTVGMPGRNSEPNAYDFVEHSNTRNKILGVYNSVFDQRSNPRTVIRLMQGTVRFAAQGLGINYNLQGYSGLRSRLVFNDNSSVVIKTLTSSD